MSDLFEQPRAQRPSSSGANVTPPDKKGLREIAGLQILRAFAAIIVVAHHALEESRGAAGTFSPDWLATSGAAGVDIFFVISGFIMMLTTFSDPTKITKPTIFLLKRSIRIYPLYWICCALVLLAHSFGLFKSLVIGGLLNPLLLVPSKNLIIGVSWTLIYEMYFYVIFAIMLISKPSSLQMATRCTIAIFILYLFSFLMPDSTLQRFLNKPITLEFCMGLWLGRYAIVNEVQIPIWVAASSIIAIVAAPVFVPHGTTSGLPDVQRVAAWGIPSVLLVAYSISFAEARSGISRFGVILGSASYALYLTHPFIMTAYAAILKRSIKISSFNQILPVIMVIIISAIISIFIHYYLEKPLTARLSSVIRR
ncbi:acyltransferase family protein [Sphingomonas crocodyli]|uniref:acyltransferase family protein n=1 Tax=Sphingomonas crocodyli TaxID=1979270 RepID=UPI0013E33CAC|nr:acyltransferase [Sphingomonas crocodyli]